MIPLGVIVCNIFLHRSCKERSPKGMSFDKHSSFADLTQRSEYAFKFGLRAGSRRVFTCTDSMIARKEVVYFVSRS
jgi:hypothetical protein